MCWSPRLLLFTHVTCNPSSSDWCSVISIYGSAREVCSQVGSSSYVLPWYYVLALLFLRTLFVLGISDKQSSPPQDYKLPKVWDHICRSRHPGDNNICWLNGWLLSPLGLMLFCDDMGEVKANLNLVRQLWHCVWTGLCVYLQATARLLQLFLGHMQLTVNGADSKPNCEASFVPSLCPLTVCFCPLLLPPLKLFPFY